MVTDGSTADLNGPGKVSESSQGIEIFSPGTDRRVSLPHAGSSNPMPHFPTEADVSKRLEWLGYPQELSRDWGFWSSLSLSYINLGATSGTFWIYQTLYVLGGPVAIFYTFIVVTVVLLIQNMVLAELASAYPAAGAMFTWTFKLTQSNPMLRSWAKFFSWTLAMYLFVSHIIFQIEDSWTLSFLILRLIKLAAPSINPTPWHVYAVSCLDLLLSGLFMLTPVSRSPRLWVIFGIVTILLSISIGGVLLATSDFRQSLGPIFYQFKNRSQIKNDGWGFLAACSLAATSGAETSAHMAEETNRAEVVVPSAIFYSTIAAQITALLLNFVFYVSLSEENTLISRNMPSLILKHCPQNASTYMLSALLVVCWIQQLSQILSSSRFVWAVARDKALPFATLWRKLTTKTRIPRRATVLFTGLTMFFSFFLGLPKTHVTLLVIKSNYYLSVWCYLVPILLYLTCEKDVLYRDGRNVWTLQNWSRPFAHIAALTISLRIIIGCFPVDMRIQPVQFPTRSLAIISLPLVFIIAIIAWFTYGRRHYVGPIKSITVWTTGQEVDLPRASATCPGDMTNPTTTDATQRARAVIHEESIPMEASITRVERNRATSTTELSGTSFDSRASDSQEESSHHGSD